MIRIKTLFLQNFRNYARTLVEFGPHVNYLQGKNGQGKTNLLEAIYFISTGRSFRTDKLCELIRDGSRFFHIEVIFEKQGIDHHLKLHFDGQKKSVEINETKSSNFSVLLGLIPSVIASPSDIDLIMGSPQTRRRYLNLHIAQSDPVYVYHLSRYNKALKQRNALLKIKQLKTMDIWEEQMAQSAAYLVDRRIRSLKKLSQYAHDILQDLSHDDETLEMKYQSSTPIKDKVELKSAFIKQLSQQRARELQYGITLSGPHRDDVDIRHNDKVAKAYSSEGQKRSILSSFRLAECIHLQEVHAQQPIFGIDDFGNHLDETRIDLLKNRLEKTGQIFLSTPELTPHAEDSFLIEGGSLLKFSI